MTALVDLIPNIAGKTVTTDALLTQRKFARYLLDRGAHFMFIVKGNQKTMRGRCDAALRRGAGA